MALLRLDLFSQHREPEVFAPGIHHFEGRRPQAGGEAGQMGPPEAGEDVPFLLQELRNFQEVKQDLQVDVGWPLKFPNLSG
jgi:hypothetical protein